MLVPLTIHQGFQLGVANDNRVGHHQCPSAGGPGLTSLPPAVFPTPTTITHPQPSNP